MKQTLIQVTGLLNGLLQPLLMICSEEVMLSLESPKHLLSRNRRRFLASHLRLLSSRQRCSISILNDDDM
jgi:hypothetical protein